jgi:endonuclease/exonuclease/phosphatase family metal-dependent hydrolase
MHIKHSLILGLVIALGLAACGDDDDDDAQDTPVEVKVMTRNLYLGADLAPAIAAASLDGFIAATGAILRSVTTNDFATRAKGLAAEILEAEPDLVGLQEVALWRTGPVNFAPLQGAAPSASTVRVDYLELLLAELNAGVERYEAVVVQDEFDFEAPADETPVDGVTPFEGADLNGRLTMRDVILRRVDAEDVTVSNPRSAQFDALLNVPILTSSVTIARGWTSVDARVRDSRTFRFVNTHLESFDPPEVVPSLRAQQAAELVASGGPATGDLPVLLVGDLNSDDDTVVEGDQQAYRALLNAGFVERSTADPLSCCIQSADLTSGDVADFDHQVDHIMTDAPGTVELVDSGVTGRTMQNGFWNSDHAGVWSVLQIR